MGDVEKIKQKLEAIIVKEIHKKIIDATNLMEMLDDSDSSSLVFSRYSESETYKKHCINRQKELKDENGAGNRV